MHLHHESKGNILFWVFLLNLLFTLIEWIGGIFVNSHAIIADAFHDTGDTIMLGIAWFLERKSYQQSPPQFTFGFRRFSTLSATLLGILLVFGSGFMLYFGIQRLLSPEPVMEKGMLLLACLGTLFNGIGYFFLTGKENHNESMIRWHLLEDILGWIAVLIGALFIYFFQWYFIDGLLTLTISLFILFQAGKRLIFIVHVLLQAAPPEISPMELKEQLLHSHQAIQDVHHLHLWTLDGIHNILTAHIVISASTNPSEIPGIKKRIYKTLSHYPIHHVTLEIEEENDTCYMGPKPVLPGEWQ